VRPHEPGEHGAQPAGGFWSSPARVGSFALLALVSLWMISMHRVHVFSADAIPIALLVACLGLHVVMHRGHGAKGDPGR
jgi:hypothetical protein